MKTSFVVNYGNQGHEKYTWTLQGYLLPFYAKKYHGKCIFQQENAAIHTSMKPRSWFDGNSANVIPWQEKSPDLNLIENLYRTLERRVYVDKKHFKTKRSPWSAWDMRGRRSPRIFSETYWRAREGVCLNYRRIMGHLRGIYGTYLSNKFSLRLLSV